MDHIIWLKTNLSYDWSSVCSKSDCFGAGTYFFLASLPSNMTKGWPFNAWIDILTPKSDWLSDRDSEPDSPIYIYLKFKNYLLFSL